MDFLGFKKGVVQVCLLFGSSLFKPTCASNSHNLSCYLFSAKDKNEKKLLGFSFFFLMEADETTIKDGGHVLCLYKCEDSLKFQVRSNLKENIFGSLSVTVLFLC